MMICLMGLSILSLWGSHRQQKVSLRVANIDLFIMSQCPYAVQAENTFYMLSQRLKNKIRLNFYYIAKEEENGNITSLHGSTEVDEDIRQLVIFKFYPHKFWKYIFSRNTNLQNPDYKADAYIAGIDIQELQSLIATKGKEIFRENIKKAAQLNIQGSPTIYINGQKYDGNRSFPSLLLLLAKTVGDKKILATLPVCFSDADCIDAKSIGVCQNAATMNAKCQDLKVSLKIIDIQDKAYLSDESYNILKFYLPSLKDEYVDYQSQEGTYFIHEISPQGLPVYLISSEAQKIKTLQWFFSSFSSSQENKVVYEGAQYLVIKNTRDETRLYLDRKRIPHRLDLFVMSQCPFGNEAVEQIYPIAEKEGIDLNIYYITNLSSTSNLPQDAQSLGALSLHGISELEEDMRQLCASKHFPQKYIEYILARNKNPNSSLWEEAAEQTLGVNARQIIAECQYGIGRDLIRQNTSFAADLHIASSPTILWENQRRFNSLQELKTELEAFKDIAIKSHGSCSS